MTETQDVWEKVERKGFIDELEGQERFGKEGEDKSYDRKWNAYQEELQKQYIELRNKLKQRKFNNAIYVNLDKNLYIRFMQLKLFKFNYVSKSELIRNLILNWVIKQEKKYGDEIDAYIQKKQ